MEQVSGGRGEEAGRRNELTVQYAIYEIAELPKRNQLSSHPSPYQNQYHRRDLTLHAALYEFSLPPNPVSTPPNNLSKFEKSEENNDKKEDGEVSEK